MIMNGETIYPKGFFMNGNEVHGIESITFAPAELNALEAKLYEAMAIPKTIWSGSFKMQVSKKKIKAFKKFTHVKRSRLPRKTKKMYKSARFFKIGAANPFRDIQYSIIAIRRGYKL